MPISPGLTEIVATTLRNRSGIFANNVLNNTALLDRLRKRGNVKPVSGGRTIVQELSYAENGTYSRYTGYESINIQPSDVLTAAEFNFAQAAVVVAMSGLEQLQNAGKEAVVDLLEARISNAMDTMMNNISFDCYSDGSANGGKQIGGLQLLISKTPTSGIVGGINRSNTFWRNIASGPSGAPTSGNIQARMNNVALQLVRGRDRTDLIVADTNYFQTYLESLQAIQRLTNTEQAGAGFASLAYYGAGANCDVVLDGGVGGACPVNTMYFVNSKYLHFRPHSKRNFVPPEEPRMAINQDAMVVPVFWAGNMTASNLRLQGVLFHS